ncbi:hypothetical protein CRV08_08315 [Halarcobacter ebronensis]|uniref:Lcl C-terminal domain-containing protein n=1 Tax=Halarcobacter ebronensis TaxID=1462615 RepID=A0A4Q0YCU9_9BACT|nr:DUF1566 domain-containing protein [Halarcobacter ebronensis]RXJ68247.1 hypothetical protein CRV08_08315 [Halarcobacter ebronensis]
MRFLLFFFIFCSFVFAQCDKIDTSRFIIFGDKVVDKKTKLTWMRCSVGSKLKDNISCDQTPKPMSFYEANDFEKNLKNAWRLPTIDELSTIYDNGCKKYAINSSLFPDIKLLENFAPFWSDTSVEQIPNLIYYIDFIDKQLDAHSKGFSMFLRLVKSEDSVKIE